jgi:hypothetical protein
MRKALDMTTKNLLVSVWFVIIGSLLLRVIFLYNSQVDKALQAEILLGHGLTMLVISAPIGWPAVFVTGTITGWFGITPSGVWDLVLASLACGIGGYAQWFMLVPWLWRRLRCR